MVSHLPPTGVPPTGVPLQGSPYRVLPCHGLRPLSPAQSQGECSRLQGPLSPWQRPLPAPWARLGARRLALVWLWLASLRLSAGFRLDFGLDFGFGVSWLGSGLA